MSTENYVYKKEVDWSLFNYGFAIPLEYQVVFTDKQWLNAPELLRSAAPLVNDYANWVHRHGAGYANSCIGDAP